MKLHRCATWLGAHARSTYSQGGPLLGETCDNDPQWQVYRWDEYPDTLALLIRLILTCQLTSSGRPGAMTGPWGEIQSIREFGEADSVPHSRIYEERCVCWEGRHVQSARARGRTRVEGNLRRTCVVKARTKLDAETPSGRYAGNTARLARRSDEALGMRVTVARITPSLLDLGHGISRFPRLRILTLVHTYLVSPLLALKTSMGRGGLVVRLPAYHQGEPGSIPGGTVPRFSHVEIVPDDAACRRVFSEISRSSTAPYFSPRLIHSDSIVVRSLLRIVRGRVKEKESELPYDSDGDGGQAMMGLE
ncbi:hypothetical protein PR048_007242 [Dryococelus australis]|uniref:Uncharacterized protein n=1 Tax=Dryococelus australis TaxID=614101 RepID=A0ABQ9IF88_9NEOP|nr:hypothetical protein PR048_007242 [Dryococelus australis]